MAFPIAFIFSALFAATCSQLTTRKELTVGMSIHSYDFRYSFMSLVYSDHSCCGWRSPVPKLRIINLLSRDGCIVDYSVRHPVVERSCSISFPLEDLDLSNSIKHSL